MTSDAKEQLDLSILRFLDNNRSRFGLPPQYLFQMARSEGRNTLTLVEVQNELEYLAGKGLVEEALKGIHPENRAWRITSNGIDFLACS